MKKYKKLNKKKAGIFAGACAVTLAACIAGTSLNSSKEVTYTSRVTDSDSALLSGDASATKQDLYEYLMDKDAGNGTASAAFGKILKKKYSSKKYNGQISTYVAQDEKQIKQMYKSIKSYCKAAGYKNKNDLEKNSLIPAARMRIARSEYTKKHYNDIKKEYNASWIEIASFKSKTTAQSVMKRISKSKYKKKAFENLKTDGKGTGSGTTSPINYGLTGSFVTFSSPIKKNLKNFAAMKKDGVYSKIIKESKSSYIIVYVYNTNEDKKTKESGISTLASALPSDYFIRNILKEHNVKVKDPKVKQQMQKLKYLEK